MLRSGVARTLTFTVDGTSAAARKLYALTSDGATALVEDDAGAVWLADIASGAARLVSAEADGTPVDMSYWFGDVSPDNTWVALFAITPDGSGPRGGVQEPDRRRMDGPRRLRPYLGLFPGAGERWRWRLQHVA